ncbi:MAG: gliding motility lipoprotein GldD [Paludibacter sp.]|nr:gliding motility lipoprotein GldD [Paludibacter sp.]
MNKWLIEYNIQKVILAILSVAFFNSCGEVSIPRPYGFFRIDLPIHDYQRIDTLNLPYSFDLSTSTVLEQRNERGEKYWIDLHYPALNANIYCSYKPVKNNLTALSEDARRFVYKHTIKADGIGEKLFNNNEKNVYGILYDIKGNTASSVQFVLTDSSKHFFRGALYFDNVPNKDSIAPMVEFIRQDIVRLMESFEWKQ